MAAPINKKIAAAKGAKAIREDQVAVKAIPGRVTSIDFEQFNTPTAQAIVNEIARPVAAPIEPPGVDQALANKALQQADTAPLPQDKGSGWALTMEEVEDLQAILKQRASQPMPPEGTAAARPGVEQAAAAGALTANAILRDKVATAEGRPIDTGDNPNWGEPPVTENPILKKAVETSAAVTKGRTINTSFGRNDRSTGFQNVSKGPGRSYSFNEMLSLNPPGESLFRLADESLDIAGASREIARSNLKKPVPLADVEAGRAIAEQVQQGTPVIEVVSPAALVDDPWLANEPPALSPPTPEQEAEDAKYAAVVQAKREARARKAAETQVSAYATTGTPDRLATIPPVDPANPGRARAGRQINSIRESLDWLNDNNGGTANLPTPAMERGSRRYQELLAQGGVLTGSSPYTDPSTPQGQAAAKAAAASAGMGAAGGGEGGGRGRVPPPRNPNDFNPDRPDRPEPPVLPVARLAGEVQLQPGLWNHLKAGWRTQAGNANYSDSVIGDTFRGRKFPEQANSSIVDKALYLGGRVGADVVGYGTRKGFWNMNPEDALGTLAREGANWAGLNGREAQLARYATASTVGLVSANYNPFNIGEGGRPTGFGAVNPTDEDPRKTDNPIGELLFDRAMLGRTGRLLPWQEFHEERPDVSYEKYAKYQDYIRGPSFLGLAKGTMDGIDGPEARVVGYRVQPEAILAAAAAGAATIAAFKYGGKRL